MELKNGPWEKEHTNHYCLGIHVNFRRSRCYLEMMMQPQTTSSQWWISKRNPQFLLSKNLFLVHFLRDLSEPSSRSVKYHRSDFRGLPDQFMCQLPKLRPRILAFWAAGLCAMTLVAPSMRMMQLLRGLKTVATGRCPFLDWMTGKWRGCKMSCFSKKRSSWQLPVI